MEEGLLLPFKPFTAAEVASVTGATAKIVDLWARSILPPKRGDVGEPGFDAMQAFGIFVGWKFLSEGAPHDRAASVALYVGTLPEKTLTQNLELGNDFPFVKGSRGTLVPHPRSTRLGKVLNLTVLLAEFKANLAREFPNG